jgi:predicted amidohydrolase YtcJ
VTDLILFGGTVLTLDERRAGATAVAVRDGRLLAVGKDEEVLALRTDKTDVVGLDGRTLCPGFIDPHHHVTLASWCQLGIDLHGCRSATQVLKRLSAAEEPTAGGWVYAFNYDPRRFTTGPVLSRHHLDRVAGGRPVLVMHFSFHEGVASSEGLRAAGIDRHTPEPPGGRITRDRGGEPTGELVETAVGPVEAQARASARDNSYEAWLAALRRYCRGLVAAGIVHVADPGVDAHLEAYARRADAEGQLPVPLSLLFVSSGGLFQPPVDRFDGPRTGERLGASLEVGALKLFADGGSRCAACVGMLESLAGVVALTGRAARLRRPGLLLDSSAPDRPRIGKDGRMRLGFLHYRPGALNELCRIAHQRQFQLAVHAACNAGIEQVLDSYGRLSAGPYRHRVEHLISLDRPQMRRLGDIGAIGVVQPTFVAQLGDEWEAMPAPPRLRSVPLRDLLDAGVTLAGSSDAPVAPFQPLVGMQAAVTRRTSGGLVHQSEQAISPLEAPRQ